MLLHNAAKGPDLDPQTKSGSNATADGDLGLEDSLADPGANDFHLLDCLETLAALWIDLGDRTHTGPPRIDLLSFPRCQLRVSFHGLSCDVSSVTTYRIQQSKLLQNFFVILNIFLSQFLQIRHVDRDLFANTER